jgi:hypothetical protein
MQREARSGRRVDEDRATSVRVINKAGGLRLWSTHLRVSRSAGQPVVELRQRAWTGLLAPALYLGFGAFVFAQSEGSDDLWFGSIIVAWVILMVLGIYVPRRAWVRAGPDGLTFRRATRLAPETFSWPEIDEVHVATNSSSREYVATISVLSSGPHRMDRPVKLFRTMSEPRSHFLARVLLATSHRYGAQGLYLGEQGRFGWKDGRFGRRPRPRDERYFRPPGSRPAREVRPDQP